jgi:hypothetical protein
MNWIEPAILFRPVPQDPPSHISVIVRLASNRAAAGRDIESAIHVVDSGIAAGAPEMMNDEISKLFRGSRHVGYGSYRDRNTRPAGLTCRSRGGTSVRIAGIPCETMKAR